MAENLPIKGACPKCNRSFDILVPSGADANSLVCACDHCGTEKKVSAFRRHHAWLLDAPRREDEAKRKAKEKAERAAAKTQAKAARIRVNSDAPMKPPPAAVPLHQSIACSTCGQGSLLMAKKYRMSGPVIVIGYIILIPSFIGMAFSVLMLFVSGEATSKTMDLVKEETRNELVDSGIPRHVIDRILKYEYISNAELTTFGLDTDQLAAVSAAQTTMMAGAAGAGMGGALVGGSSICLGISSFVGGLLGWLLIMKKKVLQCNNCNSIVATS